MKALVRAYRLPAMISFFALFGAAWFVVFSGTGVVNYDYDSLSFAQAVERGRPLFLLFHPHHLLYNFLLRQVHQCLTGWGVLDGRVMLTGELFSAFLGASGACLFTYALWKSGVDFWISAVSAAAMAACFAYWHASTVLMNNILNGFSLIVMCLAVSLVLRKGEKALGVLGLAHFFAILAHQTNALLTPAVLAVIFAALPGRFAEHPWRRLRQAGFYLAVFIALSAAAYILVGTFVWQRKTLTGFGTWLFAYMGIDEYTRQKPDAFPRACFGWTNMVLGVIQPPPRVWGLDRQAVWILLLSAVQGLGAWFVARGLWMARRDKWLALGAAGLALGALALGLAGQNLMAGLGLLAAALVLAAALRGWFLGGSHGPLALFALLWLAAYVPFFYWWEPWNIEFWLTCLPPLFILAAISLNDLAGLISRQPWRFAWRNSVRAAAAALAVLVFMSNFTGKAAFDAQDENNRYHNMLASVNKTLRPQDLLVLLGTNGVPMYFEYFQPGRRVLSIHASLKRHREEPSLAFKEIENRLRSELKRHRVYLLSEVLKMDSPDRAFLERNFDIEVADISRLVSRFKAKAVKGNTGQVYFYRLISVKPEP